MFSCVCGTDWEHKDERQRADVDALFGEDSGETLSRGHALRWRVDAR